MTEFESIERQLEQVLVGQREMRAELRIVNANVGLLVTQITMLNARLDRIEERK